MERGAIRKKYPFIYISGLFIAGIIAAAYIRNFPVILGMTGFSITGTIFAAILKRATVRNFLFSMLLFSSGMFHFHMQTRVFPTDHLSLISPEKITGFSGYISECYYREDNRHRYICQVESFTHEGLKVMTQGKLLVTAHKTIPKLTYGQVIDFHGELKLPPSARNPGQFDYRAYLQSQDVYMTAEILKVDSLHITGEVRGDFITRLLISPVRDYCQRTFRKYLDGPSHALLQALILGEKQDVDAQTKAHFQEVGVVHVLAISGLHVGFIITFVFAFLSLLRVSRKPGIWILIGTLVIYIILVRFKAPVMRASVMAVLYLAGQVMERKTSVYNILFVAAMLIILVEPREIFSPGFQFSFMAVGSILYGYERLDKLMPVNSRLSGSGLAGRIIAVFKKIIWIPFLVSLAAVLGTLPLTLYYYGYIPLYAVLANLVIIPLVGLVVFLSLFLLAAGLTGSFIPAGIGRMIQLFQHVLTQSVDLFADLPHVSIITVYPTMFQLILISLIIFILLNVRKLWRVFIFSMPLLSGMLFVSGDDHSLADRLNIDFLDVGQGDAAFVQFPNGRTMLVDGGDASFTWDQGTRTIIPYLQSAGILHLNYLVGSHAHNDHIGGFLSLIEKIKIDTLVLSGYVYRSRFFETILRRADQQGIILKIVGRGDQLYPDRSCRVYILHPDSLHTRAETYSGAECNNSSIVLKIQYGQTGVLFMGDLEMEGERPLLSYGEFLESELIKIGHHGSKTSTSQELINAVQPLVAIVSVAQKNKFKHPSARTLNRLYQSGVSNNLISRSGCASYSIGLHDIVQRAWR
ncbi:MAG: DNA internalization-related competence protein ComEC/Rec2 [Calditrichales bacterium]|nr:MAG: DNA internalization-related competence protein ComEC/Rec2 [Calditrichales bacterium]